MQRLVELLVLCAVACGGRIDDGTGSLDAGAADAKADAITTPDSPPPPPPPPPSCKPDGTTCASDAECCTNVCFGTCGVQVACATTSTKKCDVCIADNCCKEFLDCGNDAACSKWLGCVQDCEQQGQSGFNCAKVTCGVSGSAEGALYNCAQQSCGNTCSVD
jgi:hypothetical protein